MWIIEKCVGIPETQKLIETNLFAALLIHVMPVVSFYTP